MMSIICRRFWDLKLIRVLDVVHAVASLQVDVTGRDTCTVFSLLLMFRFLYERVIHMWP